MWSTVVACLAASTGWIVGTCEVANTEGVLVCAPMPAAKVKHSNPAPLKSVTPPKPFHRPTGTMASKSISSASRASSEVWAQSASSIPPMEEMVQPPDRFEQKVPSLSLRSLNSGLVARRGSSVAMTPP